MLFFFLRKVAKFVQASNPTTSGLALPCLLPLSWNYLYFYIYSVLLRFFWLYMTEAPFKVPWTRKGNYRFIWLKSIGYRWPQALLNQELNSATRSHVFLSLRSSVFHNVLFLRQLLSRQCQIAPSHSQLQPSCFVNSPEHSASPPVTPAKFPEEGPEWTALKVSSLKRSGWPG